MFLGCHLSTANGFLAMGQQALELGADTFQYFSRNPRGGAVKALDLKDLEALLIFIKENGFGPIIAHAPYTLNPCAADPKTRQFAFLAFREDLERLRAFPGAYYNFHPGSHVGQGSSKGLSLTAELLNEILTSQTPTPVLIETMAGKGTEIGRTFGEVAEIIAKVKLESKVGVCLDTCHISDGGYEVKNDWPGVLKQFDREIGLKRLKAVHFNDSLNPLGAHKDRHAKIGQGSLGLDCLRRVIEDPALAKLPFILETPNELSGYAEEIKLLRRLKEPN
jgi:deoxyribonuclease-4